MVKKAEDYCSVVSLSERILPSSVTAISQLLLKVEKKNIRFVFLGDKSKKGSYLTHDLLEGKLNVKCTTGTGHPEEG